ncbi:MAG: glycerophosphodiester phosphodiesterase family protein [Verrucomicrobiae bacterium]|nr:glycerophosphodiester phosphodiesterase family protein [Verrucomicrobiae bacterium]
MIYSRTKHIKDSIVSGIHKIYSGNAKKKCRRMEFILGMTLALYIFTRCQATETPSQFDFIKNGVVAHAGGEADFPENTLPAFRNAITLGVEWVELDIHLSKDRRLVVIHDKDTERVGDKKLIVCESDFDHLKEVDVAATFRKQHKSNLDQCPKAEIPLLEDVLQLVMSQGKSRLLIDPKPDCVPQIMELIMRMKATPYVGFLGYSVQRMKEVKKMDSSIPIFFCRKLVSSDTELQEDIDIAMAQGFEGINLHTPVEEPAEQVIKRVVRIHAAGLKAMVWTVNDAEKLKALAKGSVDYIITDVPKLFLNVKQGMSEAK